MTPNNTGGQLSDEDFEGEAPAPGSSDHKYHAAAEAEFQAISDRVGAIIKKIKEK